jgi:tetratricopeptide (TPR) repeat protein
MDPRLIYLLMPLAYAMLVLAHQAGRVLAALLLRKRVVHVQLGTGRHKVESRFGRFTVAFTSFPFSGYVITCAGRPHGYRRRELWITAAGPLVTGAITVSAFIAWVWAKGRWAAGVSFLYGDYTVTLQLIGLIGLWVLGVNIVPMAYHHGEEKHPSDRGRWKQLSRMEPEACRNSVFMEQCTLALLLGFRGEKERAGRWQRGLMRRAARERSRDYAGIYAACFCQGERYEEAAELMRRRLKNLETGGPPTREWAEEADAFGNLPLAYGRLKLLAEAREYIERAIAAFPDTITYQGTLASLQCENREYETAEPILQKVMAESAEPHDRAIAAAYLATIYARAGKTKSAQHARLAARESDHPIVKRVLKDLFLAEIPEMEERR